MSKVIKDMACPSCREKGRDKTGNHLMIFENGNGYCSRCDIAYKAADLGEVEPTEVKKYSSKVSIEDVNSMKSIGIAHRGLKKGVLSYFEVKCEVSEITGEVNKVYFPYKSKNGGFVYKVKGYPKTFLPSVGSTKDVGFFGQHKWENNCKKLVLTEGEEDALAVFSMLTKFRETGDLKYRDYRVNVGSLPAGSGSVKKTFSSHIEDLDRHDEIYICFDNDEAGEQAIKDAVEVMGYTSKLKILRLNSDYKDANECYLDGDKGYNSFIQGFFRAKSYEPSWVIDGADTKLEDIMKPRIRGDMIPFLKISKKLGGFRESELTLLTASVSAGKSAFTRMLGYYFATELNKKVGYICLEQTLNWTRQYGVALDNKVNIKDLSENVNLITEDQWVKSLGKVIKNEVYVDNFGKISPKDLIDKLHYLVYSKGCKYIIIDHLSMIVDGSSSKDEGGDYKIVGMLMTELSSFVVKSNCHIIAVNHIKRGSGGSKVASKGGEVTVESMKGGAALEGLAWNVITLARNVAEGEDKVTVHLRKNRVWGDTGYICDLGFNRDTGWLHELDEADNIKFS